MKLGAEGKVKKDESSKVRKVEFADKQRHENPEIDCGELRHSVCRQSQAGMGMWRSKD